jgi:hypothetical protein
LASGGYASKYARANSSIGGGERVRKLASSGQERAEPERGELVHPGHLRAPSTSSTPATGSLSTTSTSSASAIDPEHGQWAIGAPRADSRSRLAGKRSSGELRHPGRRRLALARVPVSAVPCFATPCMTTTGHTSSFAFLAPYGPLYLQLATVAEGALALDPSLTLLKLRQLAEAFAQRAASSAGLAEVGRDTSQHDLLRVLEQRGIVTDHIAEVFHMLRRARQPSGARLRRHTPGRTQRATDRARPGRLVSPYVR